ncbi:hypothetical protein [Anaerospora hongkongensis]|uniref:hypothetical protein n=1 Tax=Anaerospora hongkongensis TaxID=244830 RepID=UPI002FDB3C1D
MKNYKQSLVNPSQSIVESEVKTEAIYQVLKSSIPKELHTLLAALDGAYGERQFHWQEHMYELGCKEDASV